MPELSKTLVVNVAVRMRPPSARVCRVTGSVKIDTGEPHMDERIWRLFRQAALDAHELLGGTKRIGGIDHAQQRRH